MSNSNQTYGNLLSAARQIVFEAGLQALNTNLLAKKAGYGVGTVYLYFKNKEEILLALLASETQTIEIDLNQLLAKNPNLNLEESLFECFNFIRKHSAFAFLGEVLNMIPNLEKATQKKELSESLLKTVIKISPGKSGSDSSVILYDLVRGALGNLACCSEPGSDLHNERVRNLARTSASLLSQI